MKDACARLRCVKLARLSIAVVAAALALAGCGGDDNAPATTSPAVDIGAAGAPPQPAVDSGCTADHPTRLQNSGWAGNLFTTCASPDFTSLQLENDSAMVLVVRQNVSQTLSMQVLRPPPQSFADAAVNQAQRAGCDASNGPCTLPPGSTLVANDATPVTLYLDPAPAPTAAVTAAAMFARLAESKLRGRAWGLMQSVQSCASGAEAAARENVYQQDVVRHAVDATVSCASLGKQIYSELRAEPPPPLRPSEEALSFAGKFAKNFETDFAVLSLLRIGHVVH
jgi:hypothetical protein